MKIRVTVSLDENLVRNIDQRKGDISRSRMVERALGHVMGVKESSEKVGVEG